MLSSQLFQIIVIAFLNSCCRRSTVIPEWMDAFTLLLLLVHPFMGQTIFVTVDKRTATEADSHAFNEDRYHVNKNSGPLGVYFPELLYRFQSA